MAITYECRRCEREVTRSAYRVTCPDCGSLLEKIGRADAATPR